MQTNKRGQKGKAGTERGQRGPKGARQGKAAGSAGARDGGEAGRSGGARQGVSLLVITGVGWIRQYVLLTIRLITHQTLHQFDHGLLGKLSKLHVSSVLERILGDPYECLPPYLSIQVRLCKL